MPSLTAREGEVVRMLCDGLSDREIARNLSVSTTTVRSHIHHVATKLGLRDRTQVAVFALRNGLLPPEGREPGDEDASVELARDDLLWSTAS